MSKFTEWRKPAAPEIWPVEEWVTIARMFHHDWLQHGNETARKARDTAMHCARKARELDRRHDEQEDRENELDTWGELLEEAFHARTVN